MISKFKVKNYKSIKDEAVLDFEIDENIKDMRDNWSTEIGYGEYRTRLLKCLLLYGHNGSGKSNMLDALQNFIRMSCSRSNILEHIYTPYFFAETEEPIEFTIEFYAPNFENIEEKQYLELLQSNSNIDTYKLYSYSVSIGKDDNATIVVLSETYRSLQDDKILFEVKLSELKDIDNIIFERHSKGADFEDNLKNTISLFYLQQHFGNKDYKNEPIRNLFHCLNMIGQSIYLSPKHNNLSFVQDLISTYAKTFQFLDINISKIQPEKIDKEELFQMRQIPKDLIKQSKEEVKILFSYHGDKKWSFQEYESYGTSELLKYMSSIFVSLQFGSISIIDELKGVHTSAVRELLSLFQNYEGITTNNCSQFVLGTHDSNLLDKEFFRPDQIYFAEKENEQSTYYSLSDFEDLENIENYEEAYLSGKLGAIKDNLKSLGFATSILNDIEDNKKVKTNEKT